MNIMDLYVPKKCSVCGTQITHNTWSGKCMKCLTASYYQKRKAKADADGTCIRCGKPSDGHRQCEECRKKRNEWARRKRNEK